MSDENTKNVLLGNGGMNYFGRESSGDIGNQNLNVGGGYGSAAWGGNGTDGKGEKTDPTFNRIPLIGFSNNHRAGCAGLCAINNRKPMKETNDEQKETTETFMRDYKDIDISDIQNSRTDYILRERFDPVGANEAAIKLITLILICIVVLVLFYVVYVKTGFAKKPVWFNK